MAVVERDGKVLVIRRHLDGRDYAVLPGGGVEDGETAEEAVVRELREECSLDGKVAELLLEGDHGGRAASYFRITGVEGEPVLGGEEAEDQDESNQHHPMWASPKDLELMGLLPDGLTALVNQWLWPLRMRVAGDACRLAGGRAAVAALQPRPLGVPGYDAGARRLLRARPPGVVQRPTTPTRSPTSPRWATVRSGSPWCEGSSTTSR